MRALFLHGHYAAGPSTGRPIPTEGENLIGFCYFDADLGRPIWLSENGWVDGTGTFVAAVTQPDEPQP